VITYRELRGGFDRSGVPTGGVLIVHSSLSVFGRVDGGAGTVVAALRDHLGPQDTLVVPAFTGEVVRDPRPDAGPDGGPGRPRPAAQPAPAGVRRGDRGQDEGDHRNSFLHYAESLITGHRRRLRSFPYRVDGERGRVEVPDVGNDNGRHFPGAATERLSP
jgi:aminoglycoside 3-N-acetyltransferase